MGQLAAMIYLKQKYPNKYLFYREVYGDKIVYTLRENELEYKVNFKLENNVRWKWLSKEY